MSTRFTNFVNKSDDNNKEINFKLSWKNISIWLKKKSSNTFWSFKKEEYVKVLNNVSGVVNSGTLLAIMGSSGSGKTTLLTAVSQRINGIIIGDIKFNNTIISREEMKKISGFLPQQELVIGCLSIMEHLQLMARLKMKNSTSQNERNQILFLTLSRLGLMDSCHSKISVLSGGELKKLSLAEQLLTDPLFLFCDEPTTGLDSYNAEIIIKILKDIAVLGKAVLCTIHQPAFGVFEIFDYVSVLAKGSLVYYGSTEKITSYFDNIGIECPVGFNPVEFYVSCLAKLQNNTNDVLNIQEYFEKSDFYTNLRRNLNLINNNADTLDVLKNNYNILEEMLIHNSRKQICFSVQLYWLLWRCYINMIRNNQNIILRFLLYMFIAVLLSTTYWDLATNLDQIDVQNLEGLFFMIITETIFTFTYSVLHTFPEELPKILRESSDGLYDLEPYYLSKVISLIPLIIFETLCYSVIIYWSVGLTGGIFNFIQFYLPILFCALSSSAYGFLLSTSFKSVATASLVSVPIEFLGMTYSGIYIHITNLPILTAWLPYVSQFYYGTEAISINHWKSVDVLLCANPVLPCLDTGKSVLTKYGFQFNHFYLDLIALFGYFILCHIISFLSFKKRCSREAIY